MEPTTEAQPNNAQPIANDSTRIESGGKRFPFALAALIAVLTAVFGKPLYELFSYGLKTDLYSHVFLIPVVTIYLIVTQRDQLPAAGAPLKILSVPPVLIGAGALFWLQSSGSTKIEDYLAGNILAYVCGIWALCAFFIGRERLKTLSFPILFLAFLAPFPVFAREAIETFFQHTSAEASYLLFKLSGTPIFREGLVFKLPNVILEVAPQCSGIRSSLVLFITGLVASYMFLRSNLNRTLLILFVIPLAIMRNAVRITILGLLTVHVDPSWIDSELHHSGGPLFFAASLVPFFAFLYPLYKLEKRREKRRLANAAA